MKLVNSGSIGASGTGAKFQLPKPVSFPEGKLCERLRALIIQTFTADATGGSLSATDLTNLFASYFGAWNLQFGDVSPEVVDPSIVFARLREMHMAMTQRDFYVKVYDSTSSTTLYAGQLNSYTAQTITASHSIQVTLEAVRSFAIERMGVKQTDFCPGAVQMGQLDLWFSRGATPTLISGHLTEAGSPATVSIIVDTVDDKTPGRWAAVPRIRTTSLASQEVPGPDNGGALVAAWEYTSAGASTALNLYSLYADGNPIHDNISSANVQRDGYERLPLGGADLNTLATVLFDLADEVEAEDIPVASKFLFREASLDISQPQIAWLHVPAITDQYRDSVIGGNSRDKKGGEVKLVAEHAFKQKPPPPTNTASVLPVTILTRADPAFGTMPGRLLVKGSEPITHIPDAVVNQVAALHSAHGSSGDQMLARAVAAVGAAIPGNAHPEKGRATEGMLSVAQHLAPPGLRGTQSFLAGFASNFKAVR